MQVRPYAKRRRGGDDGKLTAGFMAVDNMNPMIDLPMRTAEGWGGEQDEVQMSQICIRKGKCMGAIA